jgi:predicted Zn-dependent peptidase
MDKMSISSKKIHAKSSIQTHVFPNGLRIIYETPKNSLPITSIYGYCDVGSIHENDSIRGAAHFIEHMCFKGTKKVPESKDIFAIYDDVGAFLNAFTEKRYTRYVVKTHDQFAHNCIDMLSDMMLNSTFNRKEFVKEEKVVIEESLRDNDEPESMLNDMTEAILYQGSSYSYPIDTIEYHKKGRFDYDKIIEFYHHFYRPENMIISIVSKLPFREIKRMVENSYFVKHGETLRQSIEHANTHTIQVGTIKQHEPIFKLAKKTGVSTVHLNISFRTCGNTNPDKHTLNLLKHVLSGTFGSRLTTLLREKNGLTYSSYASTTYYDHAGDFTIYAQMDYTKVFHNDTVKSKGVLPLLIDMLSDLVKNGVSSSELKTAKRNFKGKLQIELEDSSILAGHNGRDYLLYSDPDSIVSYENFFDHYMANISCADILSVIRKYFRKDRMVLTMVSEHLPAQSKLEGACDLFVDSK